MGRVWGKSEPAIADGAAGTEHEDAKPAPDQSDERRNLVDRLQKVVTSVVEKDDASTEIPVDLEPDEPTPGAQDDMSKRRPPASADYADHFLNDPEAPPVQWIAGQSREATPASAVPPKQPKDMGQKDGLDPEVKAAIDAITGT